MDDQRHSLEVLLQRLRSHHPKSGDQIVGPRETALILVSHSDDGGTRGQIVQDISNEERAPVALDDETAAAPERGRSTAVHPKVAPPRQVLPSAIGSIVAAQVSLKNRRALEEMRKHRDQLLRQLRAVTGLDPTKAVERVEEDLRAIDDGLTELKLPSGSSPPTSGSNHS